MTYIRTPEIRHAEYLRTKERCLERAKEWAKANPEKRKEVISRYNQKPDVKVYKREWHEAKMFGRNISRSECSRCFMKPSKLFDLVIHHRDGNNGKLGKPLNNEPNNLVVLCRSCHPQIHNRWGLEVLTK